MLKAASVLLVLLASLRPCFARDESPQALLEQIGLSKGICVLLGDEDGTLAIKLAQESDLVFHLQHSDDAQASAVREAAYAAGFLGSRIFVEKGPVETIHLADNLADAVVLACLPGMTEDLAQAVVDHRLQNGFFFSIAGLLSVQGFTREIFKQVAPRVSVRSGTYRILSEGRIPSSGARKRVAVVVRLDDHGVKTLYYREDP